MTLFTNSFGMLEQHKSLNTSFMPSFNVSPGLTTSSLVGKLEVLQFSIARCGGKTALLDPEAMITSVGSSPFFKNTRSPCL